MRGLQASQNDGDQPLDGGLGGQPASCRDGMQAVAGQLFGRHIIADLATGSALGQQVPDEVAELLVGSGHVGASMQQPRQVAAVMLVHDQRVGLQDRLEPLAGVTGVVPDLGELGEVLGDLAFVPGEQDRFHIREVLVRRGPADAVCSAVWDIVTDASPCSATRAAVVSRVASRTARRCASIVSSHSLGTTPLYATTIAQHSALIET